MVRFKTAVIFEVSKKFVAVRRKSWGPRMPSCFGAEVRARNRQHPALRIFPMLGHSKSVLV